MAAKVRIIYYNTEETFRAVLKGQSDGSDLELSDSSDTESDQLSAGSDQGDTETIPHDHTKQRCSNKTMN